MSLLTIEGWERYRSNNGTPQGDFANAFFQNANCKITTGRIAGRAMTNNLTSTPCYARSITPALSPSSLIVGFAFKGAVSRQFFSLIESDFVTDDYGFSLWTSGDGNIIVKFNGTTLDTTTGIDATDWVYIEFKAVMDDTVGEYDLHVDGVSVLSDTSLDTVVTTPGSLLWAEFGNQTDNNLQCFYDDHYAVELSTSPNNDFLGPRMVEAIVAESDGDQTDFTPSTGTDHFAMVQDNPCDDDATYVESPLVGGEIELFQFSDLAFLSADINGLLLTITGRADADFANLTSDVKSGGTVYNGFGTNFNSFSGYKDSQGFLWETNPDTTAQWTDTEVNAAQFGLET